MSSSRAAASSSSPSRPTGPTPRASTTTCSAASAARALEFTPFDRFPTWMWRNEEVHDFVDWLRAYNADQREQQGRLPRPRPLQPVHVDRGGARVPRRRRPRRGARRPRSLRRADALAEGPCRLRPGGARRAATRAPSTPSSRCCATCSQKRIDYAREGRRALLRRRPERARRRERRALLPRDVLRLGDVVEPARPAHVRHAAVAPRLLRAGVEGDRLGAQLARRRRRRDRDERARRAQRRPALPRGVRRRARTSSASAPTTARSPRHRTGTSRCSEMRVRPAHADSYERLFHDTRRPGVRAASARAARGPPCARSSSRRGSSARSASSIGPRPSSRATTSRRAFRCSSTSTSGSTRRRAVHPLPGVGPSRAAGLPDTYPFGL